MKSLRNSLSVLSFLLGLGVLISLVQKIGWGEILKTFEALGADLIWVMLLPIVWMALQSLAWMRVLHFDGHKVSFWHLLLAKITGEAINNSTPVSIIGGDPYRAYLLQKKAPGLASAASVIIDRTLHTLATFLMVFIGLICAWIDIPLPVAWQIALPTALLVILIGLWLLMRSQKNGLIGGLSTLLKKLGVQKQRLEKWDAKIAELDDKIGGFYRRSRVHFFEVMLWHFLSRALGVVEIWMIAQFLQTPISWGFSLDLASLTVLINMAFVFIPGSLGVMEGGYGALFYLVKINPAIGVGIQLVRRLRTLGWTAIGLLLVAFYKPKKVR